MGIGRSSRAMTFIVTRDRARARRFYEGVLGFALTYEDGFAATFDLNGISLRISTVADHVAATHTVLGWQVSDIRSVVSALRDEGVVFRAYAGFEQDELGIWTAPGGGARVAWFADPDGNLLSLSEL